MSETYDMVHWVRWCRRVITGVSALFVLGAASHLLLGVWLQRWGTFLGFDSRLITASMALVVLAAALSLLLTAWRLPAVGRTRLLLAIIVAWVIALLFVSNLLLYRSGLYECLLWGAIVVHLHVAWSYLRGGDLGATVPNRRP